LAEALTKKGVDCLHISDFEKIAEYIKAKVKKDDIVITMGAGDIYKVGDMLIKK
jgi:UDP-N-acetylmuramate--alanine ligase